MHPEKALFEAFVVPRKRQRYIELLDTKGGRDKIRRSLAHFKDLDPRYCSKIKQGEHQLPDVLRMLKGLGAPSMCYVVSADSDLDGREMDLIEALKCVMAQGMGAFVSCIPGKLAYFESEEPFERYICHRESRPREVILEQR